MGTSGFRMKPEGRRPEGFIEATSAHKKVPLYYGKIIPPPLLSPPYSIQFYYIRQQFRAVHTTFMNMYHPPISELSFVKWPLADSPKKCSSISSFYETNMYRNSRIFPPFAFIFYFVRLFFYETDFSYDNDAIIRTKVIVKLTGNIYFSNSHQISSSPGSSDSKSVCLVTKGSRVRFPHLTKVFFF